MQRYYVPKERIIPVSFRNRSGAIPESFPPKRKEEKRKERKEKECARLRLLKNSHRKQSDDCFSYCVA